MQVDLNALKPSDIPQIFDALISYFQRHGLALVTDNVFLKPEALAGVGSNSGSTSDWDWSEIDMEEFLENLEVEYSGIDQPPKLKHKNPRFQSFFMTTKFTDRSVPPILMTKAVWDGYKRAEPQSLSVVNGWFKKQSVKVPGYTGEIYGGDVYKSAFKQRPSS